MTDAGNVQRAEIEALAVPGLAGPLAVTNTFAAIGREGSALRLRAAGQTDTFTDPKGGYTAQSAPIVWWAPPAGNFMFSADVTATLVERYDAGALMARVGKDWWLKFAYEFSPFREPMIVSVVSSPLSDDANGPTWALKRGPLSLRLMRTENTVACHYRNESGRWNLIRYVACPNAARLEVGLSVQSPLGQGCDAVFDALALVAGAPEDIRSGQ